MTPQDDEKLPGLVTGAAEAEEPGEPPEDTPADATEDRAEGEEPPRGAATEDGGAQVAREAQQQIEAHIPPQFRAATERLVLAGMKVMFSPQTHELAMRQVQDAEDPAAGAAVGVAALMSQLTARVKGELPQPAIVPAALILLMEALAFLAEAGQVELTDQVVADATQDLAGYLMQKLGLTPDKVAAAQDVMRQGGGAQPAPEPGLPTGGLIGSQMGA